MSNLTIILNTVNVLPQWSQAHMTQKLSMKHWRFRCKIIIIIFPYSPRGEWGHQSSSFKQLSLLPLFLRPSPSWIRNVLFPCWSFFAMSLSQLWSLLTVLFGIYLRVPIFLLSKDLGLNVLFHIHRIERKQNIGFENRYFCLPTKLATFPYLIKLVKRHSCFP